jgi:hypothetical protein
MKFSSSPRRACAYSCQRSRECRWFAGGTVPSATTAGVGCTRSNGSQSMSTRRASIADLPFWPRHLSRNLAAAYVGVSPDTFDDEVRHGVWPAGERRGAKGGRITWDRAALDRRSDLRSQLSTETQPTVAVPVLGATKYAKTERHRDKGRPQENGGRVSAGISVRTTGTNSQPDGPSHNGKFVRSLPRIG